jgi:hypothetical protein
MNALPPLPDIARALQGEVTGSQVLAPGRGHSVKDRSLAIKPDAAAPGGFVVHSFTNDDPIACKDYVRERLGLPEWQPTRAAPESRVISRGKVVAEYVYRQADGAPYLRVQRTQDKTFWQSHWNGNAWVRGKPPGPKIPYRLPEMLAAVHDTVFVCEGEKDADRLTDAGFVATSASEGAGKWTADLNQWFAGKTVHILADNDEQGAKHARQIAESLQGVARELRIINLPELPPKGDISDWLDAGWDAGRLAALCQATPVYGREPIGLSAADLQGMDFPPVKYVVPGLHRGGADAACGQSPSAASRG